MKKIFVLVFVLALALSVTACTSKEGFSKDYVKACYDVGGLMAPNGCQIPTCPACPECPDVEPVVISAPELTNWCNADIVGIPVETEGSCMYCTINYVYDPAGKNPGDVYIVAGKAMEYTKGAYVYQYKQDRFLECIAA
ncbi:hypothetical protein GX888_01345, partial [Candidatus Dojkabacteria bacterium]|nr:hypothetical protein [Candidatus Dojkabacteria bacterium]